MTSTWGRALALLGALSVMGCGVPLRTPPAPFHFDVAIYGGDIAGYAAARTIASLRPASRILLIVPQDRLGDEATGSGTTAWQGELTGGGAYGDEVIRLMGRFYDPWALMNLMERRLSAWPGITVWKMRDISQAPIRNNRIIELRVERIINGADGKRTWSELEIFPAIVRARIYLDASVSLRLRNFNSPMPPSIDPPFSGAYGAYLTGFDPDAASRSGRFLVERDRDGQRRFVLREPFASRTAPLPLAGHRIDLSNLVLTEVRPRVWALTGPQIRGLSLWAEERFAGRRDGAVDMDVAWQALRAAVTTTPYQDALGELPGLRRFRYLELPPYVLPYADPQFRVRTMADRLTVANAPVNVIGIGGPLHRAPSMEQFARGTIGGIAASQLLKSSADRWPARLADVTELEEISQTFGLAIDVEARSSPRPAAPRTRAG